MNTSDKMGFNFTPLHIKAINWILTFLGCIVKVYNEAIVTRMRIYMDFSFFEDIETRM